MIHIWTRVEPYSKAIGHERWRMCFKREKRKSEETNGRYHKLQMAVTCSVAFQGPCSGGLSGDNQVMLQV